MKNITLILMFINFISINNMYAQTINKIDFQHNIIEERFKSNECIFPIINANENYFIIDDNEYLMIRKDAEKEEYIYINQKLENKFLLETKICIGPSKNKNASIGLILSSTKKINNTIIVDINKKGKYRIREYKDGSSKMISKGWKKNKIIKKENNYNTIHIQYLKNHYELYINNKYITEIPADNYNISYTGLTINSNSKARISYIHVKEAKQNIQPKIARKIITNKKKEKKIINTNNKKILNKKKNMIYTVQIGAFIYNLQWEKKLEYPVWLQKTEYNTYLYFSGVFNSPIEATKYKNKLIINGYKNIFVTIIEK